MIVTITTIMSIIVIIAISYYVNPTIHLASPICFLLLSKSGRNLIIVFGDSPWNRLKITKNLLIGIGTTDVNLQKEHYTLRNF